MTQNDPSGTAVEPAGKSVRLLLANADFRRVWLIGIFSGVVRWLELLAYGIYAFDLTGSAFLVTTFTLLRFIPFALFGAVTGVLVDRFGHQNVLRYSLLLMCLTSAALVWLSATDQLELWHLAIANILGGFYWTTDFPARRNLIGQLAGPNLLARALSFDAACNTLTRAAGPLCGGVLMATLGISGIINLSAVLYVMAALLAFRMMVDSQRPESVALSLAREIWGGVRFAATRRDLLAAFSITLIFNLFGFPFTALIPVIGKQVLGLSPDGVGMIAAAEGMGAVIGAGPGPHNRPDLDQLCRRCRGLSGWCLHHRGRQPYSDRCTGRLAGGPGRWFLCSLPGHHHLSLVTAGSAQPHAGSSVILYWRGTDWFCLAWLYGGLAWYWSFPHAYGRRGGAGHVAFLVRFSPQCSRKYDLIYPNCLDFLLACRLIAASDTPFSMISDRLSVLPSLTI